MKIIEYLSFGLNKINWKKGIDSDLTVRGVDILFLFKTHMKQLHEYYTSNSCAHHILMNMCWSAAYLMCLILDGIH